MPTVPKIDPEHARLHEDYHREKNWKRWGPYLSERQWGTVREDYSADGNSWNYFPHDHARFRAYRWGEDGLLGIADRQCRLCFALALWNEKDPFLKERLFGLTGPQGNHGEDVKECYFYLDSTPTHSYMKALYKYPQSEFPYARLIQENARRSRQDPEFELLDSGVFNDNRYFDVVAEYAKATPTDILIQVTVANRGPDAARLHLLPTLWFRNTWAWGRTGEGYWSKPELKCVKPDQVLADHPTLGRMILHIGPGPKGERPALLFTENETNAKSLFGVENSSPYVKDAFHEFVVRGNTAAVNPACAGTKMAAHYVLEVAARQEVSIRLRLVFELENSPTPLGKVFDKPWQERRKEADAYYALRLHRELTEEKRQIARQAYAGLLWSKQFYHISIRDWLEGDPGQPSPPNQRKEGRNTEWSTLYNRDIISMPDKWEYPWYAAWDLAFHMIPFARLDPHFAKDQVILFLREWYMHPSGQIPAYEWSFGDVNPPVHAWAAWRVYKMSAPAGQRDRQFLGRVFQKMLLNFTWWVNRKDIRGKHLFAGGFLGMDNISLFDRSQPLPAGGFLEQADGTAWMAFFCTTMLAMALELASEDPAYEDVASKFFEHFVAIVDAMNSLGGEGLWDETDGFYYDRLHTDGHEVPLRIRSMVGLVPLFAVEVLEDSHLQRLPGFRKRLEWFLRNRQDLAKYTSYMLSAHHNGSGHRLLAIPSRERLERVLARVLDENEFLSPCGVRSLSRVHKDEPFRCRAGSNELKVEYVPGESTTSLYGGNSNWRGPIWFPTNFLLIEALERYHHFYGDSLKVECPTRSGRTMNLKEVARELSRRLINLFVADPDGARPCHGKIPLFAKDPHWKNLLLFHEYFNGDTGAGLGASHQTGWTALVAKLLEEGNNHHVPKKSRSTPAKKAPRKKKA